VKRVALQMAATELGTILRLATGVREADSQGQRELALYQCREASFAAQALSHNSHLADDQRSTLREVAQDLHLIVQHMLRGRQQGAALNPLSDYQAGRLERTISKLSDMNGRILSSALEV
jgi:AraC-like DNA-binding protein